MYNRGPALTSLHDPAKGHRMTFGHIGAFDYYAIGIHQIAWKCAGSAAAKGGPQTGDRGGMSNTGLIFYLNNAKSREKLFD
jgi:hypothetical protein